MLPATVDLIMQHPAKGLTESGTLKGNHRAHWHMGDGSWSLGKES